MQKLLDDNEDRNQYSQRSQICWVPCCRNIELQHACNVNVSCRIVEWKDNTNIVQCEHPSCCQSGQNKWIWGFAWNMAINGDGRIKLGEKVGVQKHLSWGLVVNHSTPALNSTLAAGLDNRRSCYKPSLMLMKSLAEAAVVHASHVFQSLLINQFLAMMGVVASLFVRVFTPSHKPQYHSLSHKHIVSFTTGWVRCKELNRRSRIFSFPLLSQLDSPPTVWPNISWVKSSIV